jgi:hypothetical protein
VPLVTFGCTPGVIAELLSETNDDPVAILLTCSSM